MLVNLLELRIRHHWKRSVQKFARQRQRDFSLLFIAANFMREKNSGNLKNTEAAIRLKENDLCANIEFIIITYSRSRDARTLAFQVFLMMCKLIWLLKKMYNAVKFEFFYSFSSICACALTNNVWVNVFGCKCIDRSNIPVMIQSKQYVEMERERKKKQIKNRNGDFQFSIFVLCALPHTQNGA